VHILSCRTWSEGTRWQKSYTVQYPRCCKRSAENISADVTSRTRNPDATSHDTDWLQPPAVWPCRQKTTNADAARSTSYRYAHKHVRPWWPTRYAALPVVSKLRSFVRISWSWCYFVWFLNLSSSHEIEHVWTSCGCMPSATVVHLPVYDRLISWHWPLTLWPWS